jgi:hypothetical protein
MSRQRVLATKPAVVNYESLWLETSTAWANALDISNVDGATLGFDFESPAPTTTQVQALVNAHDPSPLPPAVALVVQIAADKAQVRVFMNAASGTATAVQRDDTIKAIVRYLRRRGDDA